MNNSHEDRHYHYCCQDTPDNNDPIERSRVATVVSIHVGRLTSLAFVDRDLFIIAYDNVA